MRNLLAITALLFLCATAWTYEISEADFAQRDVNGDGKISASELPMKRAFRMLDQNRDGVLSRGELGLPDNSGPAPQGESTTNSGQTSQPTSTAPIKPLPQDSKVAQPAGALGYKNATLMGHSLFFPSALHFEPMSQFAGYTRQVNTHVDGRSGPNGAPWAIWESTPAGTGIKKHIENGGVELLAMTYFGDVTPALLLDPAGQIAPAVASRYPSYVEWVNFTLAHNADSLRKVMIQVPWIPHFPNNLSDKETVRKVQHTADAIVFEIAKRLRLDYPTLDVVVVPAGDAVMAIWDRIDNLPDITMVYSKRKSDADKAVYRDTLHGGHMVYQLTNLLWMATLYPQQDIREFDYLNPELHDLGKIRRGPTGIGNTFTEWRWIEDGVESTLDLRQLAWEIVTDNTVDTLTRPDGTQVSIGPNADFTGVSGAQP